MPQNIAKSIERLPERLRPEAADGLRARFRLHIGRTSRDVVISRGSCSVEMPAGRPDTEIVTDAITWQEMELGRLSGIEAFARRRLTVRGSIEKSLQFEPLFERPSDGALAHSIVNVAHNGIRISSLVAGPEEGEPLVLIHGLGATKASWLTVIPRLAQTYRVLAIDLPGFGASSKPRGRYNAEWFSRHVFDFLDELGYERALVAGNSMGGRVAMEMGMSEPDRVPAIACLCPVAAFSHRPLLWAARMARAELGVLVSRLPRERIRRELRQLFADPNRIDDMWYEAAVDDFLRTWRSPRARLAFFTAARNIYLEEPYGENGFWARLETMKPPAFYIYGAHDVLITSRFGTRIRRALPGADVRVWKDCGHVPQLECPERTTKAMTDFFATVTAGQRAG